MTKLRIEGLADTSGDPVCLYCNKPLRRLWWMAMKHDGDRLVQYTPTVGGSHPVSYAGGSTPTKKILAFKARRGDAGKFDVFTGDFDNHGSREQPFCKQKCAVEFAIAAARAGYRVKV